VAMLGDRLPILAIQARIVPTEKGTHLVFPLAPGVVMNVVVQNGDKVALGDRLLRFRSTELSATLASSKLGKERIEVSRGTLGFPATKTVTSEQWWNASSKSGESLPSVTRLPPHIQRDKHGGYWVSATRAGTVCQLHVAPGARISPSERSPLLAIGDLARVVAVGRYHASQVSGFRKDQKAVVLLQDLGSTLDGSLLSIGNVVAPDRQTVEVRVLVDNSLGLLKPGDTVGLALKPETSRNSVVLVPSTTIIRKGATASVFVESEQGILQHRAVQLGQYSDEVTEVLDGLEAGERVATQEST
jgi:multidrug efflux pump subunit AcrA (membrane-fusion protein)